MKLIFKKSLTAILFSFVFILVFFSTGTIKAEAVDVPTTAWATLSGSTTYSSPLNIVGAKNVDIYAQPSSAATSCIMSGGYKTSGTYKQNDYIKVGTVSVSKTTTFSVTCDYTPTCTTPVLTQADITLDNGKFSVPFDTNSYKGVVLNVSGYYTDSTVKQYATSGTTDISPVVLSTYFGNGIWDVKYSAICKSTGASVTSNTIQVSNATTPPPPVPTTCTNKKWIDGTNFNWDGSKYYTPSKSPFSPYDPGTNLLCGSYNAGKYGSDTTDYWWKMECIRNSDSIYDGFATYTYNSSYNAYITYDSFGYLKYLVGDGWKYTYGDYNLDPIYGNYSVSRTVNKDGTPYNTNPSQAIVPPGAQAWFGSGSNTDVGYTRYVPVRKACD